MKLLVNNINDLLSGYFIHVKQKHEHSTYHALKHRPDLNIICPHSWNTKRKIVKQLYVQYY